jgi:hypothetical protein
MTLPRNLPRSLTLLAVVATGAAAYFLGSARQRTSVVSRTPSERTPPAFDPSMITNVPPVTLTADSVDAFLRWVASTPVSNAGVVQDAVSAARGDDEVVRVLTVNLLDLPVRDIGRHLMLLSIIGEMRRPEFLGPLVRFVGLAEESVVPQRSDEPGDGVCTSYLDAAAALQSRAVEMLAHLRTAEAFQAVLALASQHESRPVRLAALDAFAFNNDDSPDAIECARAAARPSESKMVGVPRRTRDSDPREFEARVLAFYEQYPEERPPAPETDRRHRHEHSPAPRPQGTQD